VEQFRDGSSSGGACDLGGLEFKLSIQVTWTFGSRNLTARWHSVLLESSQMRDLVESLKHGLHFRENLAFLMGLEATSLVRRVVLPSSD